jgi:hypothetical protein
MMIQKQPQGNRHLLRGNINRATKVTIALTSVALITIKIAWDTNALKAEKWKQEEWLHDPRREQVVAMQRQEEQQLAQAEKDHTYDQMKRYWAQQGGVPDILAWQTPEGRAEIMAARKAEADSLNKYNTQKEAVIGGLLGFGAMSLVLNAFKKKARPPQSNP